MAAGRAPSRGGVGTQSVQGGISGVLKLLFGCSECIVITVGMFENHSLSKLPIKAVTNKVSVSRQRIDRLQINPFINVSFLQ